MQEGNGNYQADKIRIKNGTIKQHQPQIQTTFFCWVLLFTNFTLILLLIIQTYTTKNIQIQLHHHDVEASRFIRVFEEHRMMESHMKDRLRIQPESAP